MSAHTSPKILPRGRQAGQAATLQCLAEQVTGCLPYATDGAGWQRASGRHRTIVLGSVPHHLPMHVMSARSTVRNSAALGHAGKGRPGRAARMPRQNDGRPTPPSSVERHVWSTLANARTLGVSSLCTRCDLELATHTPEGLAQADSGCSERWVTWLFGLPDNYACWLRGRTTSSSVVVLQQLGVSTEPGLSLRRPVVNGTRLSVTTD